MAGIEEKVESLLKPYVEELGCRLYDVEYAKEGKDHFLRVFIDKDTGISLTDCEMVTNAINDVLDKADYIKSEYFLEVSSPGVERVLRKDIHFKDNLGQNVEVKLFKPIDQSKLLIGTLENFDDENIYIKIGQEEKCIKRQNIAQVKIKYNW